MYTRHSTPKPLLSFIVNFCTLVLLLLGLSLAQAAPFAYVANSDDNTVTVIDTFSNTVVTTIRDLIAPNSLALTPDGKRVYVGSPFSPTISFIDTATNTLLEGPTLQVGLFGDPPRPDGNFDIALTPDGTRAYVTQLSNNTVTVFDTATNRTIGAPIEVNSPPRAVAITPDGGKAYVTHNDGSVSVINTAINNVIAFFLVGRIPTDVSVIPDGTRAYVINRDDDSISIIDTTSDTVIKTISSVGRSPETIAFTPDGRHAYVPSADGVSVIDTVSDTVVGDPILVGPNPIGVALTPDGKQAYITSLDGDSITVIDTTTNKVIGSSIPVGSQPVAIAITPEATLPFAAFKPNLLVELRRKAANTKFTLGALITLDATSGGINVDNENLVIQAGTYTATLPAGTLKHVGNNRNFWSFTGKINGVKVQAFLTRMASLQFGLLFSANTNPSGTRVKVVLGNNSGLL